jgi:1-aminocyclopropane-1-carboxylate deaminase
LNFSAVDEQKIDADWLSQKEVTLQVLRLDKIHQVVSGNKYFKLKYHLQKATTENKKTIATFGGAWSNHIVATAYACKEAGFESIGFIRGEQPRELSTTLQTAVSFGMTLSFLSREAYGDKEGIKDVYKHEDWYWINEGGYGTTGAKGAAEILSLVTAKKFTHIIAAVGTGTMLAGLISSAQPNQKIIGISSMKGNSSSEQEIKSLINNASNVADFQLSHDYHFGGYGKHPQELLNYINSVYADHSLPLDIVYTGKTFYAIEDLVKKDFFAPGSNLLMIHSGGLQGNKSLAAKVLAF